MDATRIIMHHNAHCWSSVISLELLAFENKSPGGIVRFGRLQVTPAVYLCQETMIYLVFSVVLLQLGMPTDQQCKLNN